MTIYNNFVKWKMGFHKKSGEKFFDIQLRRNGDRT